MFYNIKSFRKHVQDTHKDEFDLCMREDCTKTAVHADGMTMMHHYKLDHGLEIFKCSEHPNCNYRGTWDEAEYNKHVASHKLRCPQCLDEGSRALPFANEKNLEEHIKVAHSPMPYYCNIYDVDEGKICDKRFASEKARSQHGSRAHKSNYLCGYCQENGGTGSASSFTTEVLLARHVKTAHRDKYDVDWAVRARDKTFPCHICKKNFSSASNRAKHVRSVHEKERKWQCNITDLGDTDKLNSDSGQKLEWNHEKDGCTRAFANKQTLIDHVRSEHLGLMRWEAYRKMKSGKFAEQIFEKQEKKREAKVPNDPIGLLTGVFSKPGYEGGDVEDDAVQDEIGDE